MTIRVGERPKQKATAQFGAHSITREYWVSGATDKTTAMRAVLARAPLQDAGVDTLGNTVVISRNKVDASEQGGGVWEVMVNYSNSPSEFRLTITSGVQTTKIMQAQKTVEVYDCIDGSKASDVTDPSNGQQGTTNVPAFGNAIGVTGTGSSWTVEGVEAEIGKMEFSISKKIKFAQLSATYAQYVTSVTPSVNSADWYFLWDNQLFFFVKGSVKFRGARINQSSEGDFELVHDFSYSKGLSGSLPPAWDVSGTYVAGSQVTYLGHTWQSVRGNVDPPAWAFTETYNIGDVVSRLGHTWVSAIDGNEDDAPTIIPTWDPTTTFVPNDLVIWFESIWESTSTNTDTVPSADDGSNWHSMGAAPWEDQGATLSDAAPIVYNAWRFTQTYSFGDTVSAGGFVNQSLSNNNLDNDPTIDEESVGNWEKVGYLDWEDMGVTATPFTIGNSAPINAEGWHYKWPYYRPSVVAGVTVLIPTGLIIQQIFDYSDFTKLECF